MHLRDTLATVHVTRREGRRVCYQFHRLAHLPQLLTRLENHRGRFERDDQVRVKRINVSRRRRRAGLAQALVISRLVVHGPRPHEPGQGAGFNLGDELGLDTPLQNSQGAVLSVAARRDQLGALLRVALHRGGCTGGEVDDWGYSEHGVAHGERVPGVLFASSVRSLRRGFEGGRADAANPVALTLLHRIRIRRHDIRSLARGSTFAFAVEHRLELVLVVLRSRNLRRRGWRFRRLRFASLAFLWRRRGKHLRRARSLLLLQRNEKGVAHPASEE